MLVEVCTPEATEATIALSRRLRDGCANVLRDMDLPAHTVQLGAKGCITWSPGPLWNYRDTLAVDMTIARAQWLWFFNRDTLFPAAMDSQWLVSLQHTEAEIDRCVDVFAGFAQELAR